MNAAVQSLVDSARIAPVGNLEGVWEAYRNSVSRSRKERLKLKRELALAGDGSLISTTEMYRMPEAWNADKFPAVAIGHWAADRVHFNDSGFPEMISGAQWGGRFLRRYELGVHKIRIPSAPKGTEAAAVEEDEEESPSIFSMRRMLSWGRMTYRTGNVAIPPVPKSVMPLNPLTRRNAFVLFDSAEWADKRVIPVDPYLLQRVSADRFRVLAHWDLSPKERQLMALIR